MDLCLIDVPLSLQPAAAFLVSWAVLYLVQFDLAASKHRQLVTNVCFTVFVSYWFAYCLGVPLGRFGPDFCSLGLGDEFTFVLLMGLVYRSFREAEHSVLWNAAFSRRFKIIYGEDGPKLERYSSMADRLAEAEGKPYVPPGGMSN